MALTKTCGCGAVHEWIALRSIGVGIGLDHRQCPTCESTLAEPVAVVSAAIGRASRGWTVLATKAPPRPLVAPTTAGDAGGAA